MKLSYGTRQSAAGFTLIELMIVVAIIGILASIAIPNFIRFQSKAKQTEAKMNLTTIHKCAHSYFAEKDSFNAGFNLLAFKPEKGNRYTYSYSASIGSTTIAGSSGGTCTGTASVVSEGAFVATACGNIDTDAFIDSWSINQDKMLLNNGDDVSL